MCTMVHNTRVINFFFLNIYIFGPKGLTVKCVEEKNFKTFFKLLFTNVWEILLFAAN